MKVLLAGLTAVLMASTSVATMTQPRAIAQIDTYYADDFYQQQVGETVFYCDGDAETQGLVTSSVQSQFYSCP